MQLQSAESMLTFETNQSQGVTAIIEKLQVGATDYFGVTRADRKQALPFGKVQHKVATVDAQPAGSDGSIIVLVTGALLVPIFLEEAEILQC